MNTHNQGSDDKRPFVKLNENTNSSGANLQPVKLYPDSPQPFFSAGSESSSNLAGAHPIPTGNPQPITQYQMPLAVPLPAGWEMKSDHTGR